MTEIPVTSVEDRLLTEAETAWQKIYDASTGRLREIDAIRGAFHDFRDRALAEVDVLSRICAEAYQVVGVLASDGGRFDGDDVEKVLDNLSQQRLVHEDVLPFESADPPIPNESTFEGPALALLRRAFYANTDFDQEAWNRDVRDFLEDGTIRAFPLAFDTGKRARDLAEKAKATAGEDRPEFEAALDGLLGLATLETMTGPARKTFLDSFDDGDGPYMERRVIHLPITDAAPPYWEDFKAWAADYLGQGFSLACLEGSLIDTVTSYCFEGYRAGRESALGFGEFRCPKCGGFKWGTNATGPKEEWIGHCHGDSGCRFSWPRTDDHLYGLQPFNREGGD